MKINKLSFDSQIGWDHSQVTIIHPEYYCMYRLETMHMDSL